MIIMEEDDCPHRRWGCHAKRADQADTHGESCPFRLLRMSDGDVEAFCAEHVQACGALMLGRFEGFQASSTDTDARRWIAEELSMHARQARL